MKGILSIPCSTVPRKLANTLDMSHETDLDELSILRHGYERFLNNSGDLDDAIITVRRQQQITTHFGPLTAQNKIKVSLSQEQILNQNNRFPSKIKRSQSINIQKSLASHSDLVKYDPSVTRANAIRPSQIPVKIKEQNVRAITLDSSLENGKEYRPVRKLSAPFERRNYVSSHESNLSSLPVPMTQSLTANVGSFDGHLDQFKCGICFNILSDSRVLDCLHTFCLECLHSIEISSQSKATPNKLSAAMRSSSFENTRPDNSSNCSDESKEDKKIVKSAVGNKLTRKTLSTTLKRPEEMKVRQDLL